MIEQLLHLTDEALAQKVADLFEASGRGELIEGVIHSDDLSQAALVTDVGARYLLQIMQHMGYQSYNRPDDKSDGCLVYIWNPKTHKPRSDVGVRGQNFPRTVCYAVIEIMRKYHSF